MTDQAKKLRGAVRQALRELLPTVEPLDDDEAAQVLRAVVDELGIIPQMIGELHDLAPDLCMTKDEDNRTCSSCPLRLADALDTIFEAAGGTQ